MTEKNNNKEKKQQKKQASCDRSHTVAGKALMVQNAPKILTSAQATFKYTALTPFIAFLYALPHIFLRAHLKQILLFKTHCITLLFVVLYVALIQLKYSASVNPHELTKLSQQCNFQSQGTAGVCPCVFLRDGKATDMRMRPMGR